jgi:hypothetical protein
MDWKSIAILFGIANPEWLIRCNELTFRTLSGAEVRNGGNENMIRNWCFGSAQQPKDERTLSEAETVVNE